MFNFFTCDWAKNLVWKILCDIFAFHLAFKIAPNLNSYFNTYQSMSVYVWKTPEKKKKNKSNWLILNWLSVIILSWSDHKQKLLLTFFFYHFNHSLSRSASTPFK